MNANFYRLECLTNLHMGNGDVNYDIIDLEVEKDSVLYEPTMNASGVKGALRDHCAHTGMDTADINRLFGKENQGTAKFFSGDLLARPIRVSQGEGAYTLATTPDLLAHTLRKLHAFGLAKDCPSELLPKEKELPLYGMKNRTAEGFKGNCVSNEQLKTMMYKLLGTKNWVILTAEQLHSVDLPVQAHNVLENGKSTNLWYEQYVPHESVFAMLMLSDDTILQEQLEKNPVVQFGAEASTGVGYTRLVKVEG